MTKLVNWVFSIFHIFFKKLRCIQALKRIVIIILSICLSIFIVKVQGYAQDPSAAFVVDLEGNSHEVRRGDNRNRDSIQLRDLLNPRDVLYIPGDQRSWASLGFVVGGIRDYAGLILRTEPYSKESGYEFPCRALGGFTIAWRPVGEGVRACSEGLTVERGSSDVYSDSSLNNELFAQTHNLNSKQDIRAQASSNLSDTLLIQPGDEQIVIRATNRPSYENEWIREEVPYTVEGGEWAWREVRVERNAVSIEVLEGEIVVTSEEDSVGRTVRQGEMYVYPGERITPIDSSEKANSCEILSFLNAAYWSSPDIPNNFSDAVAEQLKQHREALGVSGRPPGNLSSLQQSVIEQINFVRKNPSGYADLLESQKQFFYNNWLKLPGESINPSERIRAVDEAINFLRSQRSLPDLSVSAGMTNASQDHVNGQGRTGTNYGHTGDDGRGYWDRLRDHGSVGCVMGENVSYYDPNLAQDTEAEARIAVVELLIDDGQRQAGSRENIFNPDFQVMGVACGSHGNFLRSMCVITYAAGYLENS